MTPRCTCVARSRATSAIFGERPRGMWPSEGSVSPGDHPAAGRAGIKWIATDEEILGCSTNGKVGRDSRGPRPPSRAALPRLEGARVAATSWRSFSATIRCRTRSGSTISAARAGRGGRLHGQAARDRRRLPAQPGDARPGHPRRRKLLGILPDGGVSFLRSLYQERGPEPADPAGQGRPVPPRASRRPTRLHHLFAGSWISHNFAIWVGHPEDNQAWDALHAARSFLVGGGALLAVTTRPRWQEPGNEIYIAEGSDWFWWYGDDHSSALDGLFDHLFRKHLRNVYTLLGSDPPGSLFDADLPRGRTSPAPRPADQFFAASRSTAARPILSGSTRHAMSAATSAAR